MIGFILISNKKLEIIAKTILDLGKAIFIAGIVSNFFDKFPLALRIGLFAFSLICVTIGIFIHPNGDEK